MKFITLFFTDNLSPEAAAWLGLDGATIPDQEEIRRHPDLTDTQNGWYSLFSWLVYDSENRLFKCSTCVAAKKGNVFAVGKPAHKCKKDDISKHQDRCQEHTDAEKAVEAAENMKKKRQNAYEKAEGALKTQMATVYQQVKNAIPLSKNRALLELQEFNGNDDAKKVIDNNVYMHIDSQNDMVDTFADIIREDLKTEIKESPIKKFSLLIDEFTDSSNKTVAEYYIRFVNKNGELRSSYAASRLLEGADAETIFGDAKALLTYYGLDLKDMVGLATDGAAVMTGHITGVATRFKRVCPWIITVHCFAHKLQLLAEKAAAKVLSIQHYIGTVNTLAKALKFSAKFTRFLEAAKSINNVQSNKIVQVITIHNIITNEMF